MQERYFFDYNTISFEFQLIRRQAELPINERKNDGQNAVQQSTYYPMWNWKLFICIGHSLWHPQIMNQRQRQVMIFGLK